MEETDVIWCDSVSLCWAGDYATPTHPHADLNSQRQQQENNKELIKGAKPTNPLKFIPFQKSGAFPLTERRCAEIT